MFRRHREIVAALGLAAALAPLLLLASRQTLANQGVDRPYDLQYVPKGSAFRFLSPSIRLSIADAYWLAAVQYIGDAGAEQRGFAKVLPLVDLVTDLDPRHGYAYHTAAVALMLAGRLDEADRILLKGVERLPERWSFPFYLAFNAFTYRADYAAAATWAERAARTPGASPSIAKLALSLKTRSGHPEDAVRFLEEMQKTAQDERMSRIFEEQYRLAVLQRDFAALDDALARFEMARGRKARHLAELVSAGLVPAIPSDPYDGMYFLGLDGKVHSTGYDFRFAPPEPAQPLPPTR